MLVKSDPGRSGGRHCLCRRDRQGLLWGRRTKLFVQVSDLIFSGGTTVGATVGMFVTVPKIQWLFGQWPMVVSCWYRSFWWLGDVPNLGQAAPNCTGYIWVPYIDTADKVRCLTVSGCAGFKNCFQFHDIPGFESWVRLSQKLQIPWYPFFCLKSP